MGKERTGAENMVGGGKGIGRMERGKGNAGRE